MGAAVGLVVGDTVGDNVGDVVGDIVGLKVHSSQCARQLLFIMSP